MKFEPLGPCIGVSVSEVEPGDLLDDRTAAALLDALEQYGVLVFGALNLDDSTQVEFGRRLGEPELFPQPGVEFPEIFTVSLDPQKAASAEYLKGTFSWHIDGATDDIPNKATMLNALAVATSGGETEFCNAYAAWEELPEGEQDEYRDMRVVHSFETAQRRVTPDPTAAELDWWRKRPTKEQPLAWKHRSGRTSLVLGATADHVVGMDLEAGRAFIARLEEWATQDRFVYRHPWRVGDLVIWDNRGTMHRALPYAPDSERLMHRMTLVGDEAFA